MSTLLERFDADPCWQAVPVEEIRRAIAIAQAVEYEAQKKLTDLSNVGSDAPWYARRFLLRADELLRGGK